MIKRAILVCLQDDEIKNMCATLLESMPKRIEKVYLVLAIAYVSPRYGITSRIQAHYEQLSEFEKGRIIGLKEAGWANQRIAPYMGRSNVAIRRCWQEWVGRF
ncbi:HTH_Tnp_Tc3_2 domain-containing protein [Trichonephila clavipes]|nr:HTH_Tnp_Tc3_2 domain-containing protein [Trichonephila clavipes]